MAAILEKIEASYNPKIQISDNRRRRHEEDDNGSAGGSGPLELHLWPLFLLIFQSLFGAANSVPWDGIIVTESDYNSLQALKHDFVDPNGVLSSWSGGAAGACSGDWAGIKCAQGQVIVIQLPWKSLSGSLSEKIGQFQALRKLSLHDNSIGGAVPAALGFLRNLRGLQLFNNRFSGAIPPELGSCPLLQTLELANNSLSGSIPESLANSTKLIRVSLGHNSLSGPIPVRLTTSSSLMFLSLEMNNFSGPIPDTWGGGKSRLRSLILDRNLFTGGIPATIGTLSELQTLDLSGNWLNGSLPESLFGNNLKNLSVLNLRDNQFDGKIPETIGELNSLKNIDLSHNRFNGEIPGLLTKIPNLQSFDVSYNNLSGPVPISLSQKFNQTSFTGNVNLCGYTASSPCHPSPPHPTPPPSRRRQKLDTKDIILILAGILVIILLITCCILICCLLKKRQATNRDKPRAVSSGKVIEIEVEPSGGKLVHFDGQMDFSADDLLCATAEILGKSTYGTVYRATMENGVQVAVKRLREKITKGQRDFEAQAEVLAKIRHPNLLALRAYYLGPKGEKLLVFDYMPNGSLATFLHGRGQNASKNWPTRLKIVRDITKGLMYLHKNANTIHANLTSSNVLLDEQTDAKISDFGLARLMSEVANANVSATAGLLGYRAPEVSKSRRATAKSDVYSLGVIMLELLTGKSPAEEAMDGQDLPQWVAAVVKEEWTNEVFDFELMRDASAIGDELLNALKLALHCVDPVPAARPELGQILRQLEEIAAAGGSGGVETSPVD
ncbi:probable leucine-rich repeat receptor-like protein kinase IMK3 [Andrographis paniculata]|uniref:probable leucine-rich repeat receptor-like protein kinase IMK3 n=1 Tax=Andrographis paniculata TaxID=175694 RepID=UPI0021E86144|nr:probable leucine-rich repeat receptor-like protein kinase IMK3 [Andrographis paniculata]XP_051122766.1 probable leucine-rich repeat receptor-like protein kinase IMK3 [Andrographis paniculata]